MMAYAIFVQFVRFVFQIIMSILLNEKLITCLYENKALWDPDIKIMKPKLLSKNYGKKWTVFSKSKVSC